MTVNALKSSYCSITNVHELPYYGVKCSSEMRIRWIDRSILFAQTEGGVEGGPYMELAGRASAPYIADLIFLLRQNGVSDE